MSAPDTRTYAERCRDAAAKAPPAEERAERAARSAALPPPPPAVPERAELVAPTIAVARSCPTCGHKPEVGDRIEIDIPKAMRLLADLLTRAK